MATPVSSPGLSLRRYAVLAIAAALVTIGLKTLAWWVTGSVGLLSDAAESGINLVAAIIAFWALTVAALPPDEEHAYGHGKAEYFSSGVEAALILVASISIGVTAWERLMHLRPLEEVWLGLGISTGASLVNGAVAVVLLRAGKAHHSITLRADGNHLLTDVWTSVGVIVGVVLVKLTGWLVLDPVVALLVAANILWTAYRLLRDTAFGLLDTTLPAEERAEIREVLARYEKDGIQFHALRSRMAGRRRFMSVHVLAPGAWTIQQGHDLCERIEETLRKALPNSTVFTHLEPAEDPTAYADQTLDREPSGIESGPGTP